MKIWRSFDHFHLIFHHQMGSHISDCIIYEFTKIITSKLINNKKCDRICRCPLVHHQPTYFTNLEKKNHCSQGLNDANKKIWWSFFLKHHSEAAFTHLRRRQHCSSSLTKRQDTWPGLQANPLHHHPKAWILIWPWRLQTKPLHHHPKVWILTINVQLQFGNLLGVPHNSMNMLIVCCTKQITTN